MVTMTVNPLSSSSYFSSSISPSRPHSLSSSTPNFNLQQCLSLLKFTKKNHHFYPSSLHQSIHSLVHCRSTSTKASSASTISNEIGTSLDLILQQMGINDRETQVLFDKNPYLKIRSFDSIRMRIQSFHDLGINGFVLGKAVLKHPDLLTNKDVDSLINFICNNLENKIESSQIERLLNATEPRFFVGFEGKINVLLHHGIPKESLVHILNNVNLTKALCLKSAEEIERTIIFLNRFGGIELIIRRPSVLNYDLEAQLIPRIGYINEISGRDDEGTSIVLRKLPAILAYTDDHLRDHVEFLRSFAGLTDEQIFRIVLIYPNLFSASRKRKLHPRIDFLKQCGLDSIDIFKFLIKAPLFLSLSFEDNLAFKLVFLIKIGYEHRTKDLAMAMGAVTRTSSKNLQEVVGVFLYYGLSCDDILAMSKKHPQILQYNHESLGEKMDYLLEEMGREVGELLAFPAFLGYKLDGRIKHRYEAKREILGEGMSLNKLLSESAEKFSMKKEKKKKKKKTSMVL